MSPNFPILSCISGAALLGPSFDMYSKGRRHNLKTGKFRTMSEKGLPPPHLSDISDFFEFQTYLKNADPPLGSISDIYEFENILMAEDPPGLTS